MQRTRPRAGVVSAHLALTLLVAATASSGCSPTGTSGDAGTEVVASSDADDVVEDSAQSSDASTDAAGDAVNSSDASTDASTEDAGDAVNSSDTSTDASTDTATDTQTCSTASDCPDPGDCATVACDSGTCSITSKTNGTACTGGNLCVLTGQCQAGTCATLLAFDCGDGNPCTADACDPKTGACSHTPATDGTGCDDGNACTEPDACKAGICTGGAYICGGCETAADCAPYDDGDLCTGVMYCDNESKPGVCKTTAQVLGCGKDTGDPCTVEACDPATGGCVAIPVAEGAACEDGDPCTTGGTCTGGTCKAATNLCPCQQDSDCGDDGNPCNGTLYCDKTSAPFACKVNPATVPACQGSEGPCALAACDPKTGECKTKPLPDGAPCTDGDAKTVGDICSAGACKPGQDISACKEDTDCAPLEDGNFCNGTLFCNKATGACTLNPASVKSCPTVDNTACAVAACDPKTGACAMKAFADGIVCDDGSACTAGDSCQGGVCTASAFVCECSSNADCAGKDVDLCVGKHYCDKGKCTLNAATAVSCSKDGDDACNTNVCDPKTGGCNLVAKTDGAACDDGNACTTAESCQDGACTGTSTCACQLDADCQDDGNLCNGVPYCDKTDPAKPVCKTNPASIKACSTVDDTACSKAVCDPKTGTCAQKPANDYAPCDADGSACTKFDTCVGGVCKAGANICQCEQDVDCKGKAAGNLCTPAYFCDKTDHTCKANPALAVSCDTSGDTPCTLTACDPKTGQCKQTLRPDGAFCSDNTLCKGPQLCKAGACVTGTAQSCDDANPCTTDACEENNGGCVHKALDAGGCDDGSVCTEKDACSKGNCQGVSVDCNDNDPCTSDTCDPATGCGHQPVEDGADCDDGDVCTLGDSCKAGACAPGGTAADCDDLQPCTTDSCDPAVGCKHKAATDGGACDDGNACTKGDTCSTGVCNGVAVDCDDNAACTLDDCDKQKGCSYSPAIGKSCDDGNVCTVGDTCNGLGFCAPGANIKLCDDGNSCTDDSCKPGVGCAFLANASTCDDGSACTKADSCSGSVCKGTAILCDDSEVCTSDDCDAKTGCVYAPKTGPCNDNDACTEGDTCKDGACSAKPIDCDDGKPCTKDSCDKTESCKHTVTDGASCDDGNPCTDQDTCDQLSCVGSKRLWATSGMVDDASQHDEFLGVAETKDGGAIAVGWVKQSIYGISYHGATRVRVDAHGKLVWSKADTGDANAKHYGTVVALPNDGAVIGGWTKSVGLSTGDQAARIVMIHADGSEKSAAKFELTGRDLEVNGSALLTDGTVGHCGADVGNPVRGIVLQSVANDATIGWGKVVTPPTGNGSFAAAAAGTNGSVWCAGTTDTSNGRIWLAHYDTTGKELKAWVFDFPNANISAAHALGLAAGETAVDKAILIGGWRKAGTAGSERAVVGRYDLASEAFTLSAFSNNNTTYAVGVAELGGGTLAMVSNTLAKISLVGVVQGDGAFGNVGSPSIGGHPAAAAVWSAKTGWTVAGTDGTGSDADGYIDRVDTWGNIVCTASGGCMGKQVSDCDDSNPCTIDACDAEGCSHDSAKDGVSCGTNKFCLGGVCK